METYHSFFHIMGTKGGKNIKEDHVAVTRHEHTAGQGGEDLEAGNADIFDGRGYRGFNAVAKWDARPSKIERKRRKAVPYWRGDSNKAAGTLISKIAPYAQPQPWPSE